MDPSMIDSITDFVPRYREYAAHKEQTDSLIRDLMIYAEHTEVTKRQETMNLTAQLRNAQFDYEDSVNSRRELQARIKELESQLSFLGRDNTVLKHRNPYVLVLIDGNGLIFKEHLIRQGLEGGKKAAYALRQAVYAKIQNPDDTEIVAKIIANLDGLAKAFKTNDVEDFMLGFTQAKASFDFIDIGDIRADSKIKDIARFNLRNYNCAQILLGGVSHDASYIPFLSEVREDVNANRVALIEGTPVIKELSATGIPITAFDTIFSTETLADRARASTASSSVVSTPASVAAAPFTYATITQKATPPPQLVLPLAPKNPTKNVTATVRVTTKPVLPPWNPGARGMDPPIPLNQNVLDLVKKRTGSEKLCNNHYLRGPCAKGDSCCFEHDHQPTSDEIKAIQFLARLNPCTNGQDCDVDNCIYGHHCPSVKDGVCVHPFCKFHPHEHPPGTKLKSTKKASYD